MQNTRLFIVLAFLVLLVSAASPLEEAECSIKMSAQQGWGAARKQ